MIMQIGLDGFAKLHSLVCRYHLKSKRRNLLNSKKKRQQKSDTTTPTTQGQAFKIENNNKSRAAFH